jgi:two-component system phosphate regulon sensor histidine kinase PhoR
MLAAAFVVIVALVVDAERSTIVFMGGIFVLCVTVLSVVVARRLAGPMTHIAEAVEQIRAGNLETRVSVNGSDEVARVAQAVNEMVGKLKEDITRLTKLERVRSEFLGNVSHELRTPIFSMQGFLETLIDGAVDDPAVNREFLKKAYNHSVRLNTLLGELITISHIESGEMKMSFRYFNLYEFLNGMVDEMRPAATKNKVTINLSGNSGQSVEVLGDKERLRVVFENLLENAIKYNKPGGDVKISYRVADGSVNISVADTGVGISPEHLPRIFERFYRVDKNRSRDVGGTGLGLAIVKHIIEAHESRVVVQSEVGKGTTFSFSLKTS